MALRETRLLTFDATCSRALGARFGWALLLCAFAFGCGSEQQTRDRAAAPKPAPAPFEYEGMYEVVGLTSVVGSDVERAIGGKIVMNAEGDGFVSTFSLSTRVATPDGVVAADLNGNGEGLHGGGGLTGTAETQMVLGAAPGLDPKFPFMPGRFGPRIQSKWTAVPDGPDRLKLEIETVAAPGEEYLATTTKMTAVRTGAPNELKADADNVASGR